MDSRQWYDIGPIHAPGFTREQLLLKNSIISFEYSTETFCSVFTRIINFSRILQNGSFFSKLVSGTLAHYFSGPVKSVKTRTCTSSRRGKGGGGCVLDQYLGMGEPLRVWNPDLLANQINTRTLSSGTSPPYRPYKGVSPPLPPRKSSQNVSASKETLPIVLRYAIFTFHIVESVL